MAPPFVSVLQKICLLYFAHSFFSPTCLQVNSVLWKYDYYKVLKITETFVCFHKRMLNSTPADEKTLYYYNWNICTAQWTDAWKCMVWMWLFNFPANFAFSLIVLFVHRLKHKITTEVFIISTCSHILFIIRYGICSNKGPDLYFIQPIFYSHL